MTYLELVNRILRRLRESEVTSVQDNTYSKLIGDFVNEAKTEVEQAHSWNALSTTYTVTTVIGTFNYVLTGAGQDFILIDATNNTKEAMLKYMTTADMTEHLLNSTQSGSPMWYNFNGIDGSGDTIVDIYPIPDAVETLYFNVVQPQDELLVDADAVSVPYWPVFLGALWRAIDERGEDGGNASSDAYRRYMNALSDAIAIDSNKFPEETVWTAV